MPDPTADSYLTARVLSASPYQLHLMTIDGAISAAKAAHGGLLAGKRQLAYFALTEARNFVVELIAGIDSDTTPDVALPTKTMFELIYRQLAEADVQQDADLVTRAIALLEHHRETWVMLEQMIREATPAGTDHNATPIPAPHRSRSQEWVG